MENFYLWLNSKLENCDDCHGDGILIENDDLFSIKDCKKCEGTGIILS